MIVSGLDTKVNLRVALHDAIMNYILLKQYVHKTNNAHLTRFKFMVETLRIAGGKQGGKNFGFLFAKMMDVLAEDMEKEGDFRVELDELRITILEWVDDVVTFALGEDQQNLTMAQVDEFAKRHKLK